MLRFLTTADNEILATATAVKRLPDDFPEVRCGNSAWHPNAETLIDELLHGARVVVCRILGGRRGWPEGIDVLAERCRRDGIVLLALGGEIEPDAEMTALSSAPAGAVAQAGEYLRHGDVDNIEQLLRFLSDTFLMTGYGFDPPHELEDLGVYVPGRGDVELAEALAGHDPARPTVAVCFYRSHRLTGNTGFVDELCAQLEAAGANALAVWSYSLRHEYDGHAPALSLLAGHVDALITTMLATGGAGAVDGEQWDASALVALDVPVLQAVTSTQSRAEWVVSDSGLTPLDAAGQVAMPEFDGRLAAGVVSFKEHGAAADSPVGIAVPAYVADPERCARVARLAVRHARLRKLPPAERKVALLLTSFPTKNSRVGMAVGLDTPASAMRLFEKLRDDGMRIEHEFESGDQLMHTLIAAGGLDPDFLTDSQLEAAPLRYPVADYLEWYATLPQRLRAGIEERWGAPPGEQYVSGADFVIAGIELGNLIVALQPPRGYGEDRFGIYHDPELPPTHHYLASYRWIDRVWGADAIVHLGKHGTLEWLPGKMLALSSGCAPDVAIADIPLVYPFVVNDPGEGTQAKRRAHALIIDHLLPAMMRAGVDEELAELERMLDDYAQLEVLDPSKLPAIAARIWTAIEAANLQSDLEISERPEDFAALVSHIDGYLCEIKDMQIKDGLHILGQAPEHVQLRGLVSAILGLEPEQDVLLETLDAGDWDPALVAVGDDELATRLRNACSEIVPKLRQTPGELDAIVRALHGRHIESGPSGAPTRGRPDVLPTGRNFYSVDPRSLPTEISWEVGERLADGLIERYRADTGELPHTIGLVVWGTAAMRTGGDDISEILALLGVRPVWNRRSRRVTGIEVIDLAELGRPRIDVTVRISGFFRDAFPGLIKLLDDAFTTVAGLDEPDEQNFVAAHARAEARELAGELDEHAAWRQATIRIFGSKPGAYGAGLLQLLETRDWRDEQDLAAVYEAWGGYAYGAGLDGAPAARAMRAAHRRIEVAVKNVDSREHDLLDSDDYYQYHGGMIATVRALSGQAPTAYLGDSSNPRDVKTRTLAEETRRVFRARVANPRWIASMIRHGYKGAAELSATVDYLFGYDATTKVADDWMYEQITERYLLEPEVAEFMARSNPWAARAIAERLLEAAERGLWESPDEATLQALRERFLDLEGEIEEGVR